MAFFKFRQSNASPAKTSPRTAEAAANASTETVESLRRRARHRLIGAVVLVLVAVIGFPLLFDTQPRPVAINAPITIPDRDSAAPLAAPAVATSLAAFAVVYFTVFGAGVFYILRLMSHAPHRDEPGVSETPIRTAGITPAPAIDPDRPIPTGEESDHDR